MIKISPDADRQARRFASMPIYSSHFMPVPGQQRNALSSVMIVGAPCRGVSNAWRGEESRAGRRRENFIDLIEIKRNRVR